MTLRVTTFQLLTTTPALVAQVPLAKWFARGAQIDKTQTPYVVLAWVGTLTTGGRNSTELLDVYVHDQVGSLVRIDKILDAIRPVLQGAMHYAGADGSGFPLVQADYLGKSQDGVDQGNGTAFRFSSWKILGGGEA